MKLDELGKNKFPCFRKHTKSSLIVEFITENSCNVLVSNDVYHSDHFMKNVIDYDDTTIWVPCEDPRKRKFKVGDTIKLVNNNDFKWTIKSIERDRYRHTCGAFTLFSMEDMHELVESTSCSSDPTTSEPEIKVGSHWECICASNGNTTREVIKITNITYKKVYWKSNINRSSSASKSYLFNNFTPRPDLDTHITEHSNVEQVNQTNQKENTMEKMDLGLLAMMAANSKHVVIVTKDDESERYFYADDLESIKAIVAEPKNELKKFHVFDYSTTLAQKPRKVIEVKR